VTEAPIRGPIPIDPPFIPGDTEMLPLFSIDAEAFTKPDEILKLFELPDKSPY
jgi:hypothetical protein